MSTLPPPPPPSPTDRIEAQLIIIAQHLRRLDHRDRIRMYGTAFHSVVVLIPMVIALLGAWYVIHNATSIITSIGKQLGSSAAQYTTDSGRSMIDDFLKQYGGAGNN